MIPTDAEINTLVHEKLLGKDYEFNNALKREFKEIADYCNDRNALPEVWSLIRKQHSGPEIWFIAYDKIYHYLTGVYPSVWNTMTATPRLHVIATLKALDKWPDDWEIPQR